MFKARRDAWVILSLLIILLAQLAALLWHLGLLPGLQTREQGKDRQRAGRILSVHNQLRQKAQGGILWDDVSSGGDIYFYDSLLTLKESEAILELENSTRIQVGESTLITIEPPDAKSPRDIFIQFSKGQVRAQAKEDPAQLKDGVVQIQLSPGSDIEYLKDTENSGEVMVRSGQVELTDEKGVRVLKENQVALLLNGEWQEQTLSEKITWVNPPKRRIYTHSDLIDLPLSWQGEADELVVRDLKTGVDKAIKSISSQNHQLSLERGSYRIRLKKGKVLSAALDIQIWQAPLIHLLNPLPRNRAKLGDISFLWTPLETSWTYEVRLQSLAGSQTVETHPTSLNRLTLNRDKEEDLLWEVWGVDPDGHLSPPAYNYPLFLRENPLQAPKLKKPQRLPAPLPEAKDQEKPGSAWMQILIPSLWAQAKTSQNQKIKEWGALLSWEPLPGADLYQLEVSEGQDFRKLVLSVELEKPEYILRSQKNPKQLYWRVAAGSRNGRLGLFSEPEVMELVDVRELPLPENQKIKVERPRPQIVERAKPVEPPPPQKPPQKEAVTAVPTESKEEPPAPTQPQNWRLWWSPTYQSLSMERSESLQAKSTGLQALSLGGQWRTPLLKSWDLLVSFHYQENHHQPDPQDRFPFQDELKSRHLALQGLLLAKQSGWLWGLGGRVQPIAERVSFEAIRFKDLSTPQAILGWQTNLSGLEYQVRLHVGHQGEGWVTNLNNRLQFIFTWGLLVGLEYEAGWANPSGDQLLEHQVRGQIGVDF